ncbi:unnamed protein product [Chrysodeixis includens]|uniref:Uncharacterized protein n=1 Tax=Chrysodeixis includens TaxID=689277 RepID=A0A9P0FNU4_CHRIL|nr:unnamed protein product [Chrysodeixis includens]
MDLLPLILLAVAAEARMFCEKTKAPLELGVWKYDLKHMDSAVVENMPVSISEGQVYVYENYFPDYIIKYIHVDNLAIRSCGASAAIRSGGVDTSSVLIVLHADINQEIRSVVDIWGERRGATSAAKAPAGKAPNQRTIRPADKNIKSLYLFKTLRAVNHNTAY